MGNIPIKIKKIKINNFRGIEKLDLDFEHHPGKVLDLVVLAGSNGCGKTSVLEACILALGQDHLLQKNKEDNIRKGEEDFELLATVECDKSESVLTRKSQMGKSEISKLIQLYNSQTTEHIDVKYFSSWRDPNLMGSVSVSIGSNYEDFKDAKSKRLNQIKQYLINLTASKAFEDD